MTAYICKCGRRVKKSTDASTTGNRLSGYAPGHECWGCPYAMPYGNYQWDESARTVSRETQGYECRMSKTLTYASEFAGSIKDKCTCRVHSLDFDFLSQVSSWIKDTYPDREIFGSFSKDIRASDYGSDGRYCLTITCTQNLKGVAAKRELLDQFFTPNGSRKDMTPQQEMEKILSDIRKCTQEPPAAEDVAVAALPPAEAAEPFGNIPAAPTFDFSALGDLSQQATEADQQFDLHYGAAQDEYLISCIYLARIHALTAKAGRYGGGTWTKWYESKGMSKSGAWNMQSTNCITSKTGPRYSVIAINNYTEIIGSTKQSTSNQPTPNQDLTKITKKTRQSSSAYATPEPTPTKTTSPVVMEFEQRICKLSTQGKAQLTGYADRLGEELVLAIISRCADLGAYSWMYIRKALEETEAQGCRSVEEYRRLHPISSGRNLRVDRTEPSGNDFLKNAGRRRPLKKKERSI